MFIQLSSGTGEQTFKQVYRPSGKGIFRQGSQFLQPPSEISSQLIKELGFNLQSVGQLLRGVKIRSTTPMCLVAGT
jgi:hypothetical protein